MNVIRTFVIQKVFLLVFTIFIFMQNKGQNETRVKLIIIIYLNTFGGGWMICHFSII